MGHLAVVCLLSFMGIASCNRMDAFRDTAQMAITYGYPAETHTLQTEDGYLLALHRIPRGRGVPDGTTGPPVLLQHGLVSSSSDWVMAGPENGLGYVLADAGYDIWMSNVRGNTYSRGHIKLKRKDKAFWNFSVHEHGVYDLPANIDYILQHTGRAQLAYIGHSMGTTMAFILISERPEYNEKLNFTIMFATAALIPHQRSAIFFPPTLRLQTEALRLLGDRPIFTRLGIIERAAILALCDKRAFTSAFCVSVVWLVAGWGSKHIDKDRLPVMLSHSPAGTSAKNMYHLSNNVLKDQFLKMDYGRRGNREHYGSDLPPTYNLSRYTSPVTLMSGNNDYVSDPKDAVFTAKRLPNLIDIVVVNSTTFNHLDFVWAKDGRKLVAEPVLRMLRRHYTQVN